MCEAPKDKVNLILISNQTNLLHPEKYPIAKAESWRDIDIILAFDAEEIDYRKSMHPMHWLQCLV